MVKLFPNIHICDFLGSTEEENTVSLLFHIGNNVEYYICHTNQLKFVSKILTLI